MLEGRPQRVVGVLGGMGPEATVDFMAKIVSRTAARRDQDHLHLLIDHNPGIPDRHAAIAGDAPSIGPQLAAMAHRLELAGADFLVMVCNTAHAYTQDIRAAISIPFISMVDLAVDALRDYEVTRVGIMAAEGCLRAGLYQRALQGAGYGCVTWEEQSLQAFMQLLYRVKAGERGDELTSALRELAAELEQRGAEVIVAACTEIPLILGPGDTRVPLLCSTSVLVQRTIELARETPPEEF